LAETKILPAIREISLKELASRSGMSPSALKEIRAGRSRPHPNNQRKLTAVMENFATQHDRMGRERK